MRICTLLSSYESSRCPVRGIDPYPDPSRWLPGHEHESHLIEKATARLQVRRLAQRGFDVYINLCDGSVYEDRAGADVIQELEQLQVPFTGASSFFYDLDRETMKLACVSAGVDTPGHVLVRGPKDIDVAAESLRFPLIVKHFQSYNSIGLTPASRVEDAGALRARAEEMLAEFGGALVEEFIEGGECTVLVTEPREGETEPLVYTPFEVQFPPGETFKHFDMKWRDWERMSSGPVADPALADRLRVLAQRAFVGVNASGYLRLDLRVDREGRPFLIDLNENCSLFAPEGFYGSADHILAHEPEGHRRFAEHIVGCALRRNRRSRRCFQLRGRAGGGTGIYASEDIEPGGIILREEEHPKSLVSRRHVERTWSDEQKRVFYQYAWPMNEDTYVMWSQRPQDWVPINHSCDPNAWLEGMDTVARRRIARGEEITLDYATFYGDRMEPFDCRCGAALCRAVIRGSDHREPWVSERYGDHVSGYVLGARQGHRA